MRNTWVDEIKIKEIVKFLSGEIHGLFSGQPEDIEQWGNCIFQMLVQLDCHQRIRDRILTHYTFMYELDEVGNVLYLHLEKLPWFI